MASVTVTSPIGATCHYWIIAQADVSVTGSGVTLPPMVHGWQAPNTDGTPSTLSIVLDDTYKYDLTIEFRNAAPIIFEGFTPSSGDLLTLLSAQGWIAL